MISDVLRVRRRGDDAPDSGIEFLIPDKRVFVTTSADEFVDVGDDRRDEFVDDAPRSPWAALATAGAVVVMLGVALVVAAPWQTDDADAPGALPEATSTTAQESASTIVLTINDSAPPPAPALDSGYIAAEPPVGFEIEGLYTTTTEQPAGWFELWAEARASRHSRRWFAAQVRRGGLAPLLSGAERVALGRNGSGLLTHTSDGIAVLQFELGDGTVATITAGGSADIEIVAMASAMGHVGLRPVFGGGFTADLEPIWAGPAVGATVDDVYAYGDPRASLGYRRRADDEFVTIYVRDVDPLAETLATFVAAEAPEFSFSGPSVRVAINERRMTAGILPGLDDLRFAQWVEGNETITVVSGMPLPDLLEVASTIKGASAESWRDAMMEARGFPPASSGPRPEFDLVGTGVLPDGRGWRVDVDRDGAHVGVVLESDASMEELSQSDAPLHLLSSPDLTVVIARLPPRRNEGFVLRVEGPSGVVDTPLERTGGVGTHLVAAHAFSEIGEFSATLLAPDGTKAATISRGAPEPTEV